MNKFYQMPRMGIFMQEFLYPFKLHLGCGKKKIHGWINIDGNKEVEPDLVEDIFELPSFKPFTCSLIYFSHGPEHCPKNKTIEIFKLWHSLLYHGGILRVSVPDMAKVCEDYVENRDLDILSNFIHGSQRESYGGLDIHYTSFDQKTLTKCLLDAGFSNVKEWDWRTTEPHAYIDDYSQAYLRGFGDKDKVNGKLMSLNLEAIK